MLRDELCNVKFLRFSLEKFFLFRYVGKKQLSKIFFENILLTALLLIVSRTNCTQKTDST